MLEHRHLKALRGTSAALVATLVALVSHVLAGAAVPGPLGVIVPLSLALPICIALAGRRLALARLTASVTISQALFHALFVFGTVDLASHTGHAHHGTAPSIPDGVGTAHAHGLLSSTPEMMLSHALAAAVTVLALRSGERAIIATLRAGRRMLGLSRARLVLIPVPEKPAAATAPLAAAAPRCRSAVLDRRVRVTRGPPRSSSH